MKLSGDVEEGIGNSHGPHGVPHNDIANNIDDSKPSSPLPEEDIAMSPESGEKSVLQAKLTNLAIQIGYAGRHYLRIQFNQNQPTS